MVKAQFSLFPKLAPFEPPAFWCPFAGDGAINFEEFEDMMEIKMETSTVTEELEQAFQVIQIAIPCNEIVERFLFESL